MIHGFRTTQGASDFEDLNDAAEAARFQDKVEALSFAAAGKNRARLGSREPDRLAGVFGNCALGAWSGGLAQRGRSPGFASVGLSGPTRNRRLGIRFHVGQRRRQRVLSKFPSGAPKTVRRELSRSGNSSSREILIPAAESAADPATPVC
jgi:hypothetical protein